MTQKALLLLSLLTGASAVMVTQHPGELHVSVGEDVSISCQVTKVTRTARIYWHVTGSQESLKNTSRVTIRNTYGERVMVSSLLISPVTANDSGLYTCTLREDRIIAHQGNGTNVSVTGSTNSSAPGDGSSPNYSHLLPLLGLAPLLLVVLLYRRAGTRPPTPGGGDSKEAEKQQDVHYAAIFH